MTSPRGGFFVVMNAESNHEISIFKIANHQVGVGYPNVLDVFPAADPHLMEKLAPYYGQRCGHFPDSGHHAVVIENPTDSVYDQMDYLSALFGQPISVYSFAQLNGQARGSLAVPFINVRKAETRLKEHGLSVWGLPSELVHLYKNKADCHNAISALKVPGFSVPEYKIVEIEQLPEQTQPFLAKIISEYQCTGMSTDYPTALMIRGAESDGNYGACILKQARDGITLKPNGGTDQKEIYPDWEVALTGSREYLKKSSNQNLKLENRAIVTRFMDISDSPGMSLFIINGQVFPLGWNGQVIAEGGSACVGTNSYQPKDELTRVIQEQYECQTADAFERFLKSSAAWKGVDFHSINGVANVDLMIPGPREIEFQRRLGKRATISVAEINPRFTNWTDALLLILGATRQPKTICALHKIIRGGVLTIDKYPLPRNVDPVAARTKIQKTDSVLCREGTRIITRITDNPMGLVIAGDIQKAQQALARLFEGSN